MTNYGGYYGVILNLLLAIITYTLSNHEAVNFDVKTEIPTVARGFLCFLLFFEVKACRYLIYQGFSRLNPQQYLLWEKFRKSCLFGIMLLFNVIWRTYSKITFLVMPFINEMTENYFQNSTEGPWPIKWLVYTAGTGILFSELLIIRYTLIPEPAQKIPGSEVWSRLLLLLYTAYFSLFLGTIITELKSTIDANLFSSLPLLLLFFFFFYLPFRWVEVLSDLSSCKNKWQQWVWGITSFGAMIVTYL